MLTELSQEIETFIEISKSWMPKALQGLAVLWLFNIINWRFCHSYFNRFGLRPRRLGGLIGIATSPVLHGDFNHLLFNSVPLFFLGLFILSMSVSTFVQVTIIVWVLGGFALWIVGRPGNHIGASGVISGYFGFILVNAYQNPSFTAVFCAAVAFYYFGGILLSLLPGKEGVSWDGHLVGFVTGMVSAAIVFLLSLWGYIF